MSAPVPRVLTEEDEQILWHKINQEFENHSGDNPELYKRKEESFVKVLIACIHRLYSDNPEVKLRICREIQTGHDS
jgi:hypothetical protein